MSQTPHGKNDWIKDNYDKLILLVVLLGLLLSCVLLVQHILSGKSDIALGMSRIGWRGQAVEIKDTDAFEQTLTSAREAASAPLSLPEHVTVSTIRVACVKCGRPIRYEALECPFCLAPQPEIYDAAKDDTDGDGIPDKIELEYGLDPQNPADAVGDLDNDGFTNLEEITAGTNPRNPSSMPDPIVKLRVFAIRPVPFYLRFVGISKLADGLRFQLNLQSLERTYFVKPGDVVLGYKVDAYDPEAKDGECLTMLRQSDQRSVRLIKGKPVTEQELAILFVSLLDRQPIKPPKRISDLLTYRGQEYKVIDIQRDNVVIQNTKSDEKVTVPMMTAEEKRAGVSASVVPAAAPTVGFP